MEEKGTYLGLVSNTDFLEADDESSYMVIFFPKLYMAPA